MIIISRCPYRISLLGGGSDLDWFVKDNSYGLTLGYALSQYTYTVINKLQSSSKRGILNYSSREEYIDIKDTLRYFNYIYDNAPRTILDNYPIQMGEKNRTIGLVVNSNNNIDVSDFTDYLFATIRLVIFFDLFSLFNIKLIIL